MATDLPTTILPVRDFSGMTRLADVLTARERTNLVRELCERAACAATDAGMPVLVVSSDEAVAEWAGTHGFGSVPDSDSGLSGAAAGAVATLDGAAWLVLHPDIPGIGSTGLRRIAEMATETPVLVPSHDGGTNVIATRGAFPFAYGPGSFHRHFAAAPHAIVISTAALSIDIDSPAQLVAFPSLQHLG